MAAIKGLHEARGDLAQDLSHSNSLQYEVVMTVESSRRCGLLALGNVSPQPISGGTNLVCGTAVALMCPCQQKTQHRMDAGSLRKSLHLDFTAENSSRTNPHGAESVLIKNGGKG